MPERRLNSCPICASAKTHACPYILRDSDTVGVLKCGTCGHVFLDDFSHVDADFYVKGGILGNRPFASTREQRERHYYRENVERLGRVTPLITNKRVLDFGCGNGQLLELAAPFTSQIEGIEPTQAFSDQISGKGIKVWPGLDDCHGPFDVIYSFHVLEHLPDPVGTLSELVKRLAPDGLIYVEVPNVNDALISLYDKAEAKRFHFFLLHLHYFCRRSLETAATRGGLGVETIKGHQRFSLANHVHWLSRGKPGGHVAWSFLDDAELTARYGSVLAANDLTDSLVAQLRPQ